MPLTIDEIKELINSGEIAPSTDDVVEEGELQTTDGLVPYKLHRGWDVAKALKCDQEWGKFNVELMRFIANQNYDEEVLAEVLGQIQIDDAHWDWFKKSIVYSTPTYHWFFLIVAERPQGACVMYHPEKSILEAGDIFYIDYVAVAPWNRPNPMASQFVKGIGRIMVKHATNYAHHDLGLRPGFSLHALPRATGFYEKIGMLPHPAADKGQLKYFEMLEQIARKFAEA